MQAIPPHVPPAPAPAARASARLPHRGGTSGRFIHTDTSERSGVNASVSKGSDASAPPSVNITKYGSASERRAERFALASVAALILPGERVRACLRYRAKGQQVSVWKATCNGAAHYKGLQVCGSVWHCPVCAAKIAETRRLELVEAIDRWKARGGSVLFLTLTNRHTRRDVLADLLTGQQKALSRLWKDRASRKLWEDIGLEGQVRAMEVTHGGAGWHPHYHVLLFVSQNWDAATVAKWQLLIAQRWQACCVAAGLPSPDLVHGCTLQDGAKAARYASKWGMPEEMTRGHTKRARKGSTPFQLLREVLETGDDAPATLFREYAKAFKGRRQLHWSHGLRDLLAMGPASQDESIAAGHDEPSTWLANIHADTWRAIRKAGARAQVLEAAEKSLPDLMAILATFTPGPTKQNRKNLYTKTPKRLDRIRSCCYNSNIKTGGSYGSSRMDDGASQARF